MHSYKIKIYFLHIWFVAIEVISAAYVLLDIFNKNMFQ